MPDWGQLVGKWRTDSILMFALAFIPLSIIIATVIDMDRAEDMRVRLAAALDAGIQAVSARPGMTDEKAIEIVRRLLAARMDGDGQWQLDFVGLHRNGAIFASVSGSVPTALTHLVGVSDIPIRVARGNAFRHNL